MYHCIICGLGFLDGLRITIETSGGIKVVYVCHSCNCGKNETEVCHMAARRSNEENSFTPAYAN